MKSYADDSKVDKSIVAIGSYDAIVKIKIFSSLTCPHCAKFHLNVVNKIKENYLESGKVKIIFIDFPLDQAAFNASKLLHCLDEKKQIKFIGDGKYSVKSKENNIYYSNKFDKVYAES